MRDTKRDAVTAAVEPELERQELSQRRTYIFDTDRREFMGLLGGGIAIVLALDGAVSAQESGGGAGPRFGSAAPSAVGAWLHIDEDGAITVYTGKVEVGQNARTSLAQAVADELRVPMESVRLVMGDTDRTPFDIGTFGSLSTPVMAPQLRRAAAAARELLLDLAADALGVGREDLRVEAGAVSHTSSGRSARFGELTRGQKLTRAIPEEIPTRAPDTWTVAGRSVPKVGGRAFVTGEHRYASDLRLPDMWYGRVLRPASVGAALASADTSAAEALPDVVVVHDGDFVGVAAPSPGQAARALEAVESDWEPRALPSGDELFAYLKSHPSDARGFRGPRRDTRGSIEAGLAAADVTLAETYTVAYIAHAPLEPRAAVARWENGALTVWTGTQRPFGVRDELAEAFRLPQERVRVLVPDTGSGYGGKHTGECAIEAARLARGAGRPVKVVWTREEEFAWAYFRPAGVIEVHSGATREGRLTAWAFHNYNSGASAIEGRYEIPNQHLEFHPAESPLRQGSYRGLAATANHFARETHMDEIARQLALDPLELRRRNAEDPRLLAVLEVAAERFGWGTPRGPDRGVGIAGGFEKGSYVATCAEVSVVDGAIAVERLVTAFECGAVVNPDGLRNQIEGAVIMGLGGALFEAVELGEGGVENPSFSRYRVPRFRDVPELETVVLDRSDLPSAGAGETPIVGVAPALGNAIFDACGVRLRSLPLLPNGPRLET